MLVEKTNSSEVFALPVSYSQERLWFLEQLEPNTPIYNIPYIATINGTVHRAAFDRAVNRLIKRHESLRTCLVEVMGKPRQAVYPELTVKVGWEDLTRLDASSSAENVQQICSAATSEPFDLRQAPLFRIVVIATPRETTIVTTIHHIISDGWSLGVFQRELAALYQEELGGQSAALPELPIQYADYAVWQRKVLEGESLERLMRYWRQQLQGVGTILEIPSDYERPLKQTHHGDVYLFELPPSLAKEIRELTEQQDATLFMTLLAAFSVMLNRLTGHDDLLVGTPIAGRKGSEVENLIGLFVNTLVLRVEMEAEMSFIDLVTAVRQTTLDAYEYQDVPFEKLVLEINPKRDLSHSPLVQVLFSLQNIPTLQAVLDAGAEVDGSSLQNLNGHTGTAKFDFAMFVSEVGEQLQISVEFNTDLFSMQTIEDICGYYTTLLAAITEDPNAALSSYPLMNAPQRDACLAISRGEIEAFSKDRGCHQLFEEQSRRTPEAPALAFESGGQSRTVTYAELDARSNQMARFLEQRGFGPGDPVALSIPRGPLQITAVLAITKIGAAYVPLDAEHPRERLELILDNLGSPRVLVSSAQSLDLNAAKYELIVLEDLESEIDSLPGQSLGVEIASEAPLYIIHTSGSTGRPKGVVMPHRSIVNLIEWQARASALPAGAVTLQFAPLSFDVASQEIFSTLTSGGCLQMIDERARREGPRLLDLLEERNVHRLFLPPVSLEQLALASDAHQKAPQTLREVIVAGDELQVTESVRSFFGRMSTARLINQYGPTESHVVSAYSLDGPVSRWPAHPPIGRPIDNVQLYVLDQHRQLVPPRVVGELYIGGVAVAHGYLNLPEESKARFIEDPFGEESGLLYRSGDLCRYDSDGNILFLGRADQQIKLRGFRIEPGEVEVVLKRHPSIDEAVVVKRRSEQGSDHLVAYMVMQNGAEPDRAELRGHLAASLPTYMIPAHLMPMPSFPLTSSGKIDRKRLPAPNLGELSQERERSYVAPRTAVEEFLVECWSELLQVDKVGIHDNFFELGGHSLTATQLVSRVRDQFDVELPLFRVFELATIELLALEIVQLLAAGEEQAELEALLRELENLSEEDSAALLAEIGESQEHDSSSYSREVSEGAIR